MIAYVSDAGIEAESGDMRLWLLPNWEAAPMLAPSDDSDAGDLEDAGLDASGSVAVYTVLAFGGPSGGSTYVAIRDLTSGATFTLAEGPRGAYDPAIAPDGQAIVVTIRDEQKVSDLWLVDRATGEQTRLTQGAQAAAATWSPDGDWIAYIRPNGNAFEVWALAIDRVTGTVSGEPHRLFGHDDLDATSGLSWTFSQLNIP
jgi:dipeptidyl aminopeptidase/acylaminoacyl peptidase